MRSLSGQVRSEGIALINFWFYSLALQRKAWQWQTSIQLKTMSVRFWQMSSVRFLKTQMVHSLYESTVAYVDIQDWDHGGQNVGVIEIYAIVALGLKEVNKDLAVELVTDLSRRFGSWFFLKRDDGMYNLIFKADLIAATVDPAELINSVVLVAIVANEEDDKIVRKYGGTVYAAD